jgi:general secretion pathway protein G
MRKPAAPMPEGTRAPGIDHNRQQMNHKTHKDLSMRRTRSLNRLHRQAPLKSEDRRQFTHVGRGDGTIRVAAGRYSQRGFSLIEIILVVVLIGGIVAFAATRILGGGDRAKVSLARAQVQTLSEKVQQFEMDTGGLPNSLEELVSSSGAGWLGPYAKESELKDPWGTALEYRMPGEGRPFDIVSLGADRRTGGESVAADIRLE